MTPPNISYFKPHAGRFFLSLPTPSLLLLPPLSSCFLFSLSLSLSLSLSGELSFKKLLVHRKRQSSSAGKKWRYQTSVILNHMLDGFSLFSYSFSYFLSFFLLSLFFLSFSLSLSFLSLSFSLSFLSLSFLSLFFSLSLSPLLCLHQIVLLLEYVHKFLS